MAHIIRTFNEVIKAYEPERVQIISYDHNQSIMVEINSSIIEGLKNRNCASWWHDSDEVLIVRLLSNL